jgi:glycosyltransferase involved in cell wall biosynthesis/protein-tyrosine-phosphatase
MASDRKTILYLDNSNTFGGAINSLEVLVQNLDRSRFIPIIVSGQAEGVLREKFPGCIHYTVPLKLKWIDNQWYRRLRRLLPERDTVASKLLNLGRSAYWILFVSLPESFRYARIGKRHRVDLIHLNNILGSQLAGILAAKWLRVPCVAHLRDFEEIDPVTRAYARMVDHHVAISEPIRKNLLDLGIPEGKISLIYDGIDLEDLPSISGHETKSDDLLFGSGRRRVGLVGRIVEWKGIREFILALQMVVEKDPVTLGVIIGDASDGDQTYFDAMVDLAGDLDLRENIVFTGFRQDIPRLMAAMDVIVHASTRPEPFGRVLIEAMAMEKPVVATRGGGPLEIVREGKTGILVEPGDAEEMGQAVLTLLSDPELCRAYGLAGKERAERFFSGFATTRQVEVLYDSLIGRPMLLRNLKEKIPLPVKRQVKNLASNVGDSFRYLPTGWRRDIGKPKRILFVCQGNICRSIFAEIALREMVTRREITIESCGLGGASGVRSPANAVLASARFGIDLSSHFSQKINADRVDAADLVFAMEYRQLVALSQMYPGESGKLRLLRPFAPLPFSLLCNINDPYGRDQEEFRQCFTLIWKSLKTIVPRL